MKERLVDYYKILQVDPEAEADVIEAAYKRLARKYHPDVNKSPDANERMTEINCAYQALCNPDSRAEYHQLWQQEHGMRHYANPAFGMGWFSGPRPTVTLDPSEIRFENVEHGVTVEADVTLSLSGKGRFQGEMRPHQGWLKAKVIRRRKGAVTIRVTVETSLLRGGVSYEGSVGIYSAMYGTVLIPVRVSVAREPKPILRVEPQWLDAGFVNRSDEPATLNLKVSNAGDGELVGEIIVKHGWLAVDRDRFNGDTSTIEVTVTPSTLKPGRSYTGKLEIHSSGGLVVVPVKVATRRELPDLPQQDSEEYWPAVIACLAPGNAWEKDFVGQVKILCKLRGWRPSASQQSTIINMLSRALEEHGTIGKE